MTRRSCWATSGDHRYGQHNKQQEKQAMPCHSWTEPPSDTAGSWIQRWQESWKVWETGRKNVRRKVPAVENIQVSKTYTKNEPVAGRNIFHRAWPWLGAELAPWLWTGRTKEVRTPAEMQGDPGRHGRFAAIEGWVYTRPCRAKTKTFYFVYPSPSIFVPDTEKCPSPWLIHLRYVTINSLIF